MKWKYIVLIFLLLLCSDIDYVHAKSFLIDENKSKITYSLSKFGIPFKIKSLVTTGLINIEKINSLESPCLELKGLSLKTNFTSKLSLFRRVIEYDKYPYFSFDATFENPVILNDLETVTITGFVTFHGVSKKVEAKLKCNTKGELVSLAGFMNIKMSEFGITPPKIFFIRIDDLIKTKIELHTSI